MEGSGAAHERADATLLASVWRVLWNLWRESMTSNNQTKLKLEEHGATLVVRIDGGENALLTPELAAEIDTRWTRSTRTPTSTPSCSPALIPIGS
jgi:hypothetical protein